MVKNLTEGNPLKLLFFFALPMVVGNLFQQLYNMVDSMVVGRFVGEDALAAVGSSFPVVFLAVAVAAGLSMGCTVVISQLFGAGQIREMKITVSTALISLGVIGLVIMGIGEMVAEPLLTLLGTDPDIMADSLAYLRIYFGGAVFLFLYNSLNGIYNALGDSQTPPEFSHGIRPDQYCPGPAVCYSIQHGCGGCGLGNSYSPGHVRCFFLFCIDSPPEKNGK